MARSETYGTATAYPESPDGGEELSCEEVEEVLAAVHRILTGYGKPTISIPEPDSPSLATVDPATIEPFKQASDESGSEAADDPMSAPLEVTRVSRAQPTANIVGSDITGQGEQLEPDYHLIDQLASRQDLHVLTPEMVSFAGDISTFRAMIAAAQQRRRAVMYNIRFPDIDPEQLEQESLYEAARLVDEVAETYPRLARAADFRPNERFMLLTYNVAYFLQRNRDSDSTRQLAKSAILERLQEFGIEEPLNELDQARFRDANDVAFGNSLADDGITSQERSRLEYKGRTAVYNVADWLLLDDQNAANSLLDIRGDQLEAAIKSEDYAYVSDRLKAYLGEEYGVVARSVYQDLGVRIDVLKQTLIGFSLATTNDVKLYLDTIADILADNLLQFADTHPPRPLPPVRPHTDQGSE